MLSSRCAVVVLVASLMVLQTSLAQEETTKKPCRMLKCRPDCKPGKGEDGCPICDCPPTTPTCENYPCDEGYVCELKTVQCFRAPCNPIPTCVAVQEPAVECPMVKCAPYCVPDRDSDGCPTCACDGPTCENYACDDGSVCELQTVACFTTPCYPQPTCVAAVQEEAADPCPLVRCAPYCVPDRGDDGCPTCACDGPTCENYACDAGSVCQLETVSCFTTPCYPQPTCVAAVQEEAPSSCPMIKCSPDCLPGTRSDGCPSCDCPARPSCQTVRCSAGHECQLVEVTCETDPCYPQPQCVPVEEAEDPCPPQEPCNIRCRYGLKTDKNGCPLCQCLSKPRRS